MAGLETLHQRVLPRARRTRHDEQQTGPGQNRVLPTPRVELQRGPNTDNYGERPESALLADPMTTDWILIRRAAAELERALRGGRVTDAGLLDDGRSRSASAGSRRRGPATLAIDAFGSPPLVTLEDARAGAGGRPGLAADRRRRRLRGMRLASVRGPARRPGAGADLRHRLALRGRERVAPGARARAALRQRRAAARAASWSRRPSSSRRPRTRRARVQVGLPYEPPPLPKPTLDSPASPRAGSGRRDARPRRRALGGYLPELPRLVAASLVAGASGSHGPRRRGWRAGSTSGARAARGDRRRARRPGRRARLSRRGGGAGRGARRAAGAVRGLAARRDAGAARRVRRGAHGDATRAARAMRRNAAAPRCSARIAKRAARRRRPSSPRSTRASRRRRRRATGCGAAGDALYTHGHEIPAGATEFVPADEPGADHRARSRPRREGQRAALLRALPQSGRRAAAPRAPARRAARARAKRSTCSRSKPSARTPPTLAELEAELDELEGRPPRAPRVADAAARAAAGRAPSGARIYVGRSPRENAEVTFRIARPDDLWFHARGIPGSHVVLQAPPGARAGRRRSGRGGRSRRDALARRRTRRASRSTTPSANTCASSATARPDWSGTPTRARASGGRAGKVAAHTQVGQFLTVLMIRVILHRTA